LVRRNSLLTALVVTTAVVTAALSWAGWRLLEQQRAIDDQRAQQTLDAAAASIAASIRGRLAEAGDRLSAVVASPETALPIIDSAVLLRVSADGSLAVAGERGLPFLPSIPSGIDTSEVFAEGQALEFARNDLAGAAARYEGLARSGDAVVQAGALLRLGRVRVKSQNARAALTAYRQLATIGGVHVEGLPADFVGLIGQRTAATMLREDGLQRDLTARLVEGLDAGIWPLTRRQAAYYRDELGAPAVPPAWLLAEAVDAVWTEFGGTLPARGQRVFGDGDRSALVMWRAGSSTIAVLAAFLDEFLPPAPSGLNWRLEDPEGRWIAGDRTGAGGQAATPRPVGDAEYPWMLHVASSAAAGAGPRGGQRTLVAMMAAMLLFLWAAVYVMARAIRREAAVARLQSDFVAAVSHEFRSPLTTIRQMTEMLEMGRIASDDRRQAYYQVLAGEAARLQRLVETLLNFGRMEAGAARYTLTDVDVPALIGRVVQEVEPIVREAGKRIEVSGQPASLLVRADENALALAVRNLVDNAVKYSPGEPVIRVEWNREGDNAAIRVIDRGIGIPRGEQETIFEKFVRGRSAIDANVAGTGVGLSMVRQILAAHDGAVRVDSEVGRGSTFTLALPAIDSQFPTPNSQEAVVQP
jgi:signal transduction histidine kinase